MKYYAIIGLLCGILQITYSQEDKKENIATLTVNLTKTDDSDFASFMVQCLKIGSSENEGQFKEIESKNSCIYQLLSTGKYFISVSQLQASSLPMALPVSSYNQIINIQKGNNQLDIDLMRANLDLVVNKGSNFPYFFPKNKNVIVGKLTGILPPQEKNPFSDSEESEPSFSIPPIVSPCIAVKSNKEDNLYTASTDYIQPGFYILTIYERVLLKNRYIELIHTEKMIHIEKNKFNYTINI